MEIVLKTLEANPDNEEVAGMSADIEAAIAGHEAKLVTLREKRAALEAQLPAEPAKAVPKFDPEQHPMLKKGLEKAEPEKPVVFNTGDVCEARWTDGLWYKAKVKTILGSASAPKFHVLFVEYNDTATLDRDALRPIQSKRKRDPEPAPTPASQPAASTPVTSTPHVISGPASVNPKAQPAAPSVPLDALEPKKRKIPNKKQLEKGVTSWKNWNSKGVGKKISQKDSMFRTGTNVNSRGELLTLKTFVVADTDEPSWLYWIW